MLVNGGRRSIKFPTQPNEPVVIAKKSITADNLTNVFSQYLLYHYRVDVELPRLRNLVGTQTIENGVAVNCSKRGTVIFTALASTITANYNSCETEVGAIFQWEHCKAVMRKVRSKTNRRISAI